MELGSKSRLVLALKLLILIGSFMAVLSCLLISGAQAASRTLNVGCAQDIDSVINGDSPSTTTSFRLAPGCTHTSSATLQPEDGDEILCQTRSQLPSHLFGSGFSGIYAVNPHSDCTIAGAAGLTQVMKPQGTFFMDGVLISGGDYTGQAGTGVAIAEGQMANDSWIQFSEIRNTEGAGISNAHGVHHGIELSQTTTDPNALGHIGSGIKGVDEFNIQHSFVHDNQGNGIWCDVHCDNVSGAAFSAAHFNSNLIVNNGRAGIRWERIGRVNCGSDCSSTSGQAIIENNRVAANGTESTRGGIDIRDAQDALVRNNIIGPQTIAGVSYPHNTGSLAIRATDSGRSDRPDLFNIDLIDNDLLAGEIIKGCGGVVFCSGNN